VARGAVIRDGLAVGTGMTAVMAAEAARRVHVAKVIRVSTPGDTHVGEDIAEIDRRHLLARLLHRRALRPIDFRVIGLIKLVDLGSDALLGDVPSAVIYLKNLDCFLLDIGKVCADSTD